MIPEEFRAIRKRMGLSQAQLAERLGYGAATRISEIETGAVPMPRLIGLLMLAWGDALAREAKAHADTRSRSAPHARS